MKIAVLRVSYEGSGEAMRGLDPACDPARFLPGHEWRHFEVAKATAARTVLGIARDGYDAVVNLCDGAWHGDTAGVEVVEALERLNVAFTGAGSKGYDPSREAMKMAFHAVGVAFPAYVMARTAGDVERAAERLRFPLLVKHPQGYSSVGLTPASRVEGVEALRAQAAAMMEAQGAALIEEFIEGREFTVLVTEGEGEEGAWAYEPVEQVFPEGESFKHFDLKWKGYAGLRVAPVGEEELRGRLRRQAALAFEALGCRGYARCDFRADAAGRLYLLEVNPNCAVFYPEGSYGCADEILARSPGGHAAFLERQLRSAARRRAEGERVWALDYTPERGFGMRARRAIRAGEVVERYEERAATLVTRTQARRAWTGHRRRWFEQYAWPLTDETHVMWSADPEEWRPVNHSCDPTTWLEGLDVVARRDIAEGEELTMDYATFCGPEMEQFECYCGAPECRHVITASDYLLPEVHERYRGHVSDYVERHLPRSGERPSPAFFAKRNQYGVALASRRVFRTGEVVCGFDWGKMHGEPTVHSIQAGEGRHAEPRPFLLRYINHSCEPNVVFDIEEMVVRAVREVRPGDELTFFYPSTEWRMTQPFQCGCGTEQCVGWVTGAADLAPEVLARYDLTGVVARRTGLRPRLVGRAASVA